MTKFLKYKIPIRNCASLFIVFLLLTVCPTIKAEVVEADSVGGISLQDLKQTAAKFEDAFTSKDIESFNSLYDWNTIIDTAIDGLFSEKNRIAFKKGFLEGCEKGELVRPWIDGTNELEHSQKLLRIFEHKGSPHLLFRVIGKEGTNYHDYTAAEINGEIKVVEIYPYTTAENITKTLRNVALPIAQQQEASLLNRLLGSEASLVKNYEALIRADALLKSEKFADAFEVYESLPLELKQTKAVLVNQYRAAVGLESGEKMTAVISEWGRVFPGDPAVLILSIDTLFLQRKFKELEINIDKLDKAVGGDPYLDIMRLSGKVAQEDWQSAGRLASQMAARGSELIPYWSAILQVAIKVEDNSLITLTLNGLKESGFDIELILQLPDLKDFISSQDGKTFLAEMESKDSVNGLEDFQNQIKRLEAEGQYAEALSVANKCVRLVADRFGVKSEEAGDLLYTIGHLNIELQKYEQARLVLEKSLAIKEELFGGNGIVVDSAIFWLGYVHYKKLDHKQAEEYWKKSLSIKEKEYGEDDADLTTTLYFLGQLYADTGRVSEAIEMHLREYEIEMENSGPDHKDTGLTCGSLALLYERNSDFAKAEPMYKQAKNIQKTLPVDDVRFVLFDDDYDRFSLRHGSRTWTDSSGKYTREGHFVKLADGVVELQLTSGKPVRIPLEKLSEQDQEYAGKTQVILNEDAEPKVEDPFQ